MTTMKDISEIDHFKSIIPGPKVIKLFSFSAQLNMKFQLLIKTKNAEKYTLFSFQPHQYSIYHANCWHFNIYEHGKFYAQLS